MNEPSHQDIRPIERQTGCSPWIPMLLCLPAVVAALYMGGLTGFIRWEERATIGETERSVYAAAWGDAYTAAAWSLRSGSGIKTGLQRGEQSPLSLRIRFGEWRRS